MVVAAAYSPIYRYRRRYSSFMGGILYGPAVHTKTYQVYIFPIFANNVWSHLLWSPVNRGTKLCGQAYIIRWKGSYPTLRYLIPYPPIVVELAYGLSLSVVHEKKRRKSGREGRRAGENIESAGRYYCCVYLTNIRDFKVAC